MKTLLRIDASIRTLGSITRELADDFQARWLRLRPDGKVVRRDLATDPLPHISQETVETFQRPSTNGSSPTLSDDLIRELKSSDHLLIASPLYNLSLPSALKAYIDHVVRSGLTFELEDGEYRGLLSGKSATVITARGGSGATGDGGDFQTGYLQAVLGVIGIKPVEVIVADGTSLGEAARRAGLEGARRQIEQLMDGDSSQQHDPHWSGPFEEQDKIEIAKLRQAQATAIVNGDAEAYAALCTDDIQLMIPGRDVISGRRAFVDAERALFSGATFSSFEKSPVRVERDGNLAVEIGRQSATTRGSNGEGGVFSAQQKYTHILCRTSAGWRFAVLMSNPSE